MSSPTPQGARNIRILKRVTGQNEPQKPVSDPADRQSIGQAPPGTTTEEDYAKVRYLSLHGF